MLAKKKKLSRKEIKEDKLVTSYYNTKDFIENNSRTILMYTGIFIAVVAVVFFYINNQRQNEEQAALHLSKVMPLYDSGSYLEAIEGQGTNAAGLKKIVDQYGSTESGETAKIYLANSYNFLGKTEEAYKYYEDYSGSIDLFKSTALAGQASYFASKNEYEKAADLYRRASRVIKDNPSNADYMLKSGINYLYAGKQDSAKDLFETIKKDYQATPANMEADKYLAQID
jgi:tetratricopeptide (TPR) repeat protein